MKFFLTAILTAFTGLGFVAQAADYDISDFKFMADCATPDSRYICNFSWDPSSPMTYGELAAIAPCWEWFVEHNNLPSDTNPNATAPIMTMFAYTYREDLETFEKTRRIVKRPCNEKATPRDAAATPNSDKQIVEPLSPSARVITRDLLAAYKNDSARIGIVSNHADYAALAWAAYEDGDALALAKERGWTPFKSFGEANFLGAPTSATLFVSEAGKHVLAFRGTSSAGDWVTNVNGTLSANPLSNTQIEGARKVVREVAEQFPGVVFVGHSLGGRMAQVARLTTGKAAVVFNTAPLGANDRLNALGKRTEPKASLQSFRSPEDPLSSVFSPSDVEVSNVRSAGISVVSKLFYAKDLTHSMAALTRAMQDVRQAQDEGWIAAYSADNK